MSYTKEMFNAIKRKDSVELKKQFDTAVRSKIAGQFDVKKKEIAQSMFEDVTNESAGLKPGMRVKVKDTGNKGTVIKLKGEQVVIDIDKSGKDIFSKDELEKLSVEEDYKEDLSESKLLSARELDIGKSYTFIDEIGQTFRATVKKIEREGSDWTVKYTYDDDKYAKKGKTDEFEVDVDEKVFK